MKSIWNEKYKPLESEILDCIRNFDETGETLYDGRNKIKIFRIGEYILNVKSFRVPNLVNKVAYKFVRKSKAERSFDYASYLIGKGIGTPEPVACFEEESGVSFGKSYYVSAHVNYDLTYRELVQDSEYPDHERILRGFTRFTYGLHENNVLFLDHSPGNTLIEKRGEDYKYYLVDLNRMKFKELSDTERYKNFSRLTPKEEMVEIMADEYAKLTGKDPKEVYKQMWYFTNKFQEKYWRKQRLKQKLKK
ncbi:Kdo domain containing protein [Christiangramia salexigens]|uniref:Kdo domain containing protein n=1 Tax=Christiangramia salexigens TaxID=1913577 RepID=A0A1L3J4C5_9FLAO|nr:Kdo domain containing protein [Christiangramia salexigens]APG59985.1 Kdo domain containing protein [Christiangramia salexigens]